MNEIGQGLEIQTAQNNRMEEIVKLHAEIGDQIRVSLKNAIRIGELLVEQKNALPHGKFTSWLERNLPFTDRTARNYMKIYHQRSLLKTETVSALKEAYRLLAVQKVAQQDAQSRLIEATAKLVGLCDKAKRDIERMEQRLDVTQDLGELATIAREAGGHQHVIAEARLRGDRAAGELLGATVQ